MKPDIRWQMLLAATGFILVLGLLSYQVQSAAFCTMTVPASGGYLTTGVVGRPVALNPLLADAHPLDSQLTDLIFDGLVRFDESGEPAPALAESWSYSEDGLTIRFVLRDGLLWQDGEPVTTEDVAFTYGLMQQDEFPGLQSLRDLWQAVTITIVDDRTIDFTLQQPFSPFLEATARGVLPAHLLREIPASQLATAAFNRSPVGTGPFVVDGTQNWEQTGVLRLLPNPDYWREGTQLSGIETHFVPDEMSLLDGARTQAIQLITDVAPVLLPEYAEVSDVRLVTSLAPQLTSLLFNLDSTQTAVRATTDVNVRKAIAFGLDRQLLVDETLNGQGIVFDGPYLPESWAYNQTLMTAYTADPVQAAALLDEAGWSWAEGQPFRQQDGRQLVLTLLAFDSAGNRALADAITNQLAASGIGINLQLASEWGEFSDLLATRQYDLALTDINPTHDPDLYDFWSQEAIVRGQNYPAWNNRRASEALESARQIVAQADRQVYYETFLRQFDADLPALSLYQHINTVGLSNAVQAAGIGRVYAPRDLFDSFASWFFRFRDVTVPCPQPAGEP